MPGRLKLTKGLLDGCHHFPDGYQPITLSSRAYKWHVLDESYMPVLANGHAGKIKEFIVIDIFENYHVYLNRV